MMSTRKLVRTSNGMLYAIGFVVIVVAFLLLGGWTWMQGVMHGNGLMGMHNWNWAQILVSLGIGFILGLLVSRRS
jgi:hypothetical protein